MEVIYEKDVNIIETIQSSISKHTTRTVTGNAVLWTMKYLKLLKFLGYSDIFEAISNIFDPRYAFLIYAPLVFSLDWKIGKKLMWVVIAVEWTNHLLKWLLHGERPYWWVHEAEVYNKSGIHVPDIHQFSLTCETGPGSPSGHSQITAAVWYAIFDSFLEKYSTSEKGNYYFISRLCWLVYFVLLAAIGASRVFIAAHFPHQCFFGMFLGWLIAHQSGRIHHINLSIKSHCVITIAMFSSALTVYAFLKTIGSDPMWTLQKAVKWCAKPEYIHLDTTPFFAMMRYTGFTFGMGFAFNSNSFEFHSKQDFDMPMKITSALTSVGICLLSDTITFSKKTLVLFYFQAFLLSACLAYCVIALIPKLVAVLWPKKDKVS